jgi:phosphoribosyl 1,2-cyclic phosphodiesterase
MSSTPTTRPHGPRFRVRCWGARGSVPSPGPDTVRYGGHTACLEVRDADDTLLVLDAGTGLRALGRTLAPGTVAHVFLTHQHGDHVHGLPHFAPLLRGSAHGGGDADREDPGPRVHLTSGTASREELQAVLATLVSPPFFPPLAAAPERVAVHAFAADAPAAVTPRLVVHRLAARHPGGAVVLRIDDEHGPAIAYAPDNELDYASSDPDVTSWRRGLARALHGVPLLVHDATYRDEELPRHRGWGHSSALEATRFALECAARRLVLFHHHPDRSDAEVDALVQAGRMAAERAGRALEVIGGAEGLTLEV